MYIRRIYEEILQRFGILAGPHGYDYNQINGTETNRREGGALHENLHKDTAPAGKAGCSYSDASA